MTKKEKKEELQRLVKLAGLKISKVYNYLEIDKPHKNDPYSIEKTLFCGNTKECLIFMYGYFEGKED